MSDTNHDSLEPSSDELDEDYHYAQMVTPPRSSLPLLYVTPRHRAVRTASLSTAAKNAVISKSRTPERCFMTLENAPKSAIEVCHFIPKGTKASEVGFALPCFFLANAWVCAAFGTGVQHWFISSIAQREYSPKPRFS
jgi:hypothetical protein